MPTFTRVEDKLDFLNIPLTIQRIIISKCSLVSWSRLMRTSVRLEGMHSAFSNKLFLKDENRALWFVSNKSFVREASLTYPPSPEEIMLSPAFVKHESSNITVHFKNFCFKLTQRNHSFIIPLTVSSLKLTTDVLEVWDYPKSEMHHLDRLIRSLKIKQLCTVPSYTSQRSLFTLPSLSRIYWLQLPNSRIDSKQFLDLRNPVIIVDCSHISHYALLQFLFDVQNNKRSFVFMSIIQLSSKKWELLVKKKPSKMIFYWKSSLSNFPDLNFIVSVMSFKGIVSYVIEVTSTCFTILAYNCCLNSLIIVHDITDPKSLLAFKNLVSYQANLTF